MCWKSVHGRSCIRGCGGPALKGKEDNRRGKHLKVVAIDKKKIISFNHQSAL